MSQYKRSDTPRGGLFPRPLTQCVERVTKKTLKENGAAETRLVTHWPDIVGPTLAQFSRPQKVTFHRDGKTGATLQLLVHSGWAPEFQHQEPLLIERIAAFFGYPAISRITLKQGHIEQPEAPAKTAASPIVPNKAGLSESMKQSIATVGDPELRAALDRLGSAVAADTLPASKT